jgi:putative membrane protein
MHNWGGHYPAAGLFPEITIFLFWVAAIIGIVFLIRHMRGTVGTATVQHKESSAIEVLKDRYARGEIEKDEFEEKLQVLKM